MSEKAKLHFPISMKLLVLALLEEGDRYGYQIIRDLELRSDHTFTMSEGTIYPILHGLERGGDLSSYLMASETGRRRKYYRLTKQGVRTLSCKRREWEQFCSKIGRIVGGEACVVR